MAGKNHNLTSAKRAKNDEFYTQLTDIEKELVHYKDFLQGKIVLCNCDDPRWSNFWKYFHLNFSHIGLKKLIATHYDAEQATYMLEYEGGNDADIEEGKETPLQQNGDFRSPECIKLLQEADVVVTNPPFSLFREYVAQLIEYGKKFIIIGNQNAITYKEIFPLLKDNKIWLGFGFSAGNAYFGIPEGQESNYAAGVYDPKTKLVKFRNCAWFTNIDHSKRHEPLTLFRRYYDDPSLYPHYDNYDAINVDKVADIPCDYFEAMGVPITFLDKYCPDQFEILGLGNGRSNFTPTKDYIDPIMHKKDGKTGDGDAINRVLAIDYPTPPHVSTTQRQTQDICSHHTHGSSSGGSTRSIVLRLSDGSVKILCNALTPSVLKNILVSEYGYQESELTYCSGEIGVPITFLDKYSPEQFDIVGADFELAERMPLPDGKVGTGRFYHSGGGSQHVCTPGSSSSERYQVSVQGDLCWIRLGNHSKEELRDILENWFGYKNVEYCSGVMGVPITWLDKYCPEQFEIVWTTDRGGDGELEYIKIPNQLRYDAPTISQKGLYKRIMIKRRG